MQAQALLIPFSYLHGTLQALLYICTALALLVTLSHKRGLLQRFIQHWVEEELSKATNGTKVTIGSLHYTLLQLSTLSSIIVLKDVVLHNPNRKEWKWDSPLLARTGRLEVTFHLLSLIQCPLPPKDSLLFRLYQWLDTDGFLPLARDVYSVSISDVQCFAEKRRNVFNFHLLDARLDIPDAREVLASINIAKNQQISQEKQRTESGEKTGGSSPAESTIIGSKDNNLNRNSARFRIETYGKHERDASLMGSHSNPDCSTTNTTSIDLVDYQHLGSTDPVFEKSTNTLLTETKANAIVMQMLGAVTNLGRAANEGGTRGLSDALKNQKDGFVSHLKKVQSYVGTETSTNPNISNEQKSRSSKIAKEGLQVINEVGRVVKKNVLDMKEQVDALSKPPPVKEGWVQPNNTANLYFRFGNIVIKDIRVFTKDMILAHKNVVDSSVGLSSGVTTIPTTSPQSSEGTNIITPCKSTTNDELSKRCQTPFTCTTGWSKPIHIKEVKLHPGDLSPPASQVKKDNSPIPIIGCPIEDIGQIILTRILTETAKSSTGQVFNNAFSEVIDWLEVKGMNGA